MINFLKSINPFRRLTTMERIDRSLTSHERAILHNYLCIARNQLEREYSERKLWSLQHDAQILNRVINILDDMR